MRMTITMLLSALLCCACLDLHGLPSSALETDSREFDSLDSHCHYLLLLELALDLILITVSLVNRNQVFTMISDAFAIHGVTSMPPFPVIRKFSAHCCAV